MRWMSVAVLGAAVFLVSGCGKDPYGRLDLGQARPVVSGCVEAMGGLQAWRGVGSVSAKPIVTMYDAEGRAFVTEQEHLIDLRRGWLRARGRLPQGNWKARVTARGGASFRADGFEPSAELREQMLEALRVTLHRLRGPLNLCGYGERAGGAREVHVAGMDLIRVPAVGSKAGVVAYYFDAETNLLRMVTTGADAPGGEGTVTLYSYVMSPEGLAFPSRIVVRRIGRHVLVGSEPVLEVEYRQVRF